MRSAIGLVWMLAGCDSLFGLSSVSPTPPDAAADAFVFAKCENVAFGPREDIPELAGLDGGYPTMRNDQLEMFWIPFGATSAIFRASRPNTGVPFMPDPLPLPFYDGVETDFDPAITADGKLLAFSSNRESKGSQRFGYVTSPQPGGGWTTPQRVPGLEAIEMYGLDLSYDGLTLYFVDTNGHLQQAERADIGSPFGAPLQIGTGFDFPSVSSDKLELFYGDSGIYYSTRSSPTATFTPGVLMFQGEAYGDLTPDGQVLTVSMAHLFRRSCP